MKQRLVLAAALAALAVPMTAQAQLWLQDRQYREGIGVRVGDLELHPALGGDVGYDSNYFQRAEEERVAAAYRLRITPSLTLSTLSEARRQADPGNRSAVQFRASAYATYHELFAAESPDPDNISDDRHVDVGANLNLQIMPQSAIGADLQADYQLIGEPSNTPEAAFDRGVVHVGPGVTWRPGGQLFEWRLGYDFYYNYLPDFSEFDNLQHAVVTRGRWRFLPRTALLYDASYRFIRYTNEDDPQVPSDGDILNARVGLTGLLTPKLALLGLIGWTSSFYDDAPENADTLLAQAEIAYYFGGTAGPGDAQPGQVQQGPGPSVIRLGYLREMQNSYLSSFYTRDRGYAVFEVQLGGAFVASLEGGFSHLEFPPGLEVDEFSQNRIDAKLFAEYRFSNSFGVNGSVLYDRNMSEDMTPVSAAGIPYAADNLDYDRFQAYVGARWFL